MTNVHDIPGVKSQKYAKRWANGRMVPATQLRRTERGHGRVFRAFVAVLLWPVYPLPTFALGSKLALQTLAGTDPFDVPKIAKNGVFLEFGCYNGRVIFFLPAISSEPPSPKLPTRPEIGPIGARKRSELQKPLPRAGRVWSDCYGS